MTVVIPTNPPIIYLKSYKTASTSFEIALLNSVSYSFKLGLEEPNLSFNVSIDAIKFGLPNKKNTVFFKSKKVPFEKIFRIRGFRRIMKYIGIKYLKQHQSVYGIRHTLGEQFYNQSIRVTTIRNPWDLVVSRYRWMLAGEGGQFQPVNVPFRKFVEGITVTGFINSNGKNIKIKKLKDHIYPFVSVSFKKDVASRPQFFLC